MGSYIHGLTITSIKDLETVIGRYHMKHNSAIADIDSTNGEIIISLTSEHWKQGMFSQLVLHHTAGSHNITLNRPNTDSLSLLKEGDAALFTCIRTGDGTSSVFIGTDEILAPNTSYGVCLLKIYQGQLVVQKLQNV